MPVSQPRSIRRRALDPICSHNNNNIEKVSTRVSSFTLHCSIRPFLASHTFSLQTYLQEIEIIIPLYHHLLFTVKLHSFYTMQVVQLVVVQSFYSTASSNTNSLTPVRRGETRDEGASKTTRTEQTGGRNTSCSISFIHF